ncbi:MAG: TldD/PmbA family protein [Candidatus Brocadiales bacterium]
MTDATVDTLRDCVGGGLEATKKDGVEMEVFASWNELVTMRLNYTSDIPSMGVQEPKSIQSFGVGVKAVFSDKGKVTTGFGSESNDLRPRAVKAALRKARRYRFSDPDFHSLPSPAGKPTLTDYHDPVVMEAKDADIVDLGWKALRGALTTFKESGISRSIIVGGDVCVLKERMAIKSTTGIDEFDESTILTATITTMVEDEGVKGTGWSIGTHLERFDPEAAGREAAESAVRTIGGERIPPGEYEVVFGRQPVTDLISHILAPSLSLSFVNASNTPFLGKLGKRICSSNLSIYDHGALPGQVASRRVTCEGIPTGRTDLVSDGLLVGFLANNYLSRKLSGPVANFEPRNGFRFHTMGRDYDMQADISPTNIVVEGREEVSGDELFSGIKEGVYIGRIWYTYPINGMVAGDFTSTVIADSFLIRDGKISTPLKPNTIRINSNINHIFNNVHSVGKEKKATLVWAAEEAVIAPEIRVTGVRLDSIATS